MVPLTNTIGNGNDIVVFEVSFYGTTLRMTLQAKPSLAPLSNI